MPRRESRGGSRGFPSPLPRGTRPARKESPRRGARCILSLLPKMLPTSRCELATNLLRVGTISHVRLFPFEQQPIYHFRQHFAVKSHPVGVVSAFESRVPAERERRISLGFDKTTQVTSFSHRLTLFRHHPRLGGPALPAAATVRFGERAKAGQGPRLCCGRPTVSLVSG